MGKDKHQKHKKQCERYKSEGRREQNKRVKQARHESLIAKIAHRRETGKTYEYKKINYPKDSAEFEGEKLAREEKVVESNMTRFGEFKRLSRVFGRLDRDIKAVEDERRKEAMNAKKSKKKKEPLK